MDRHLNNRRIICPPYRGDRLATDQDFPEYTYVPGGPWPHPNRREPSDPCPPPEPIEADSWRNSPTYARGFRLFHEGYYWEAHEVWESLWHALGRHGPDADLLKALIKMAAAGVKVREGRPRGVVTHALRAEALFLGVRDRVGPTHFGLDLEVCARRAREVAEAPPIDPSEPGARVSRVFRFEFNPR